MLDESSYFPVLEEEEGLKAEVIKTQIVFR